VRQRRFADAGDVFNEQVAARQEATDRQFYRFGFANDDFADLFDECINLIPHTRASARCRRGATPLPVAAVLSRHLS
jgi:hypothetical protein